MAYTFARRDQLAREEGWQSYGHKRAAQLEAKALAAYGPEVQQRAMNVAQDFTAPGQRRAEMRLWAEGARALAAGDHERAAAIGARLPASLRLDPNKPESVFWYH